MHSARAASNKFSFPQKFTITNFSGSQMARTSINFYSDFSILKIFRFSIRDCCNNSARAKMRSLALEKRNETRTPEWITRRRLLKALLYTWKKLWDLSPPTEINIETRPSSTKTMRKFCDEKILSVQIGVANSGRRVGGLSILEIIYSHHRDTLV